MGFEKCETYICTTSPIHVQPSKPFCVSSALVRSILAFTLRMDVARSTLVYWESNTYSMNGLSIYVHFHRLWLRAFVWFICSRFSFGMSSALLFFFLFHFCLLLSHSLALPLSLYLPLFSPSSRCCCCCSCTFSLSFNSILFYLASQCGITMHLQWSMTLLLYTLTLINADTLKHKLNWGNGCVLNIDILHACKCLQMPTVLCVFEQFVCVWRCTVQTDINTIAGSKRSQMEKWSMFYN